MPADERVLPVDVDRRVATLGRGSPADRNALSRAVRAPLRSALPEAIAGDPVRGGPGGSAISREERPARRVPA